jgi:GTPase SAR1 family protein
LLGLDNAGKTTILKSVTNESMNQISPTKGFNVKLVEKDCVKFTFWDLGGQSSIRHVWENYFEGNDAIVRNFFKNKSNIF